MYAIFVTCAVSARALPLWTIWVQLVVTCCLYGGIRRRTWYSEISVRVEAGSGVRAGLFVLFVALLALLAPLQTAAGVGATSRTTPAETSSSYSPLEHREKETRERLSKLAAQSRSEEHADEQRVPLPANLQTCGHRPMDDSPRWWGRDAAETTPSHDCVRNRHSPASLQVYRH